MKFIVEAESKEDLLDGIYSQPKELIQCKDCKWYDCYDTFYSKFGFSCRCKLDGVYHIHEYYCYYGKRRTE